MIEVSYTSYSLPKELVAELMQLGKDLDLGYSSAADAVKDAIRWRMDQLRTAKINRQHISKAKEPKEAEA